MLSGQKCFPTGFSRHVGWEFCRARDKHAPMNSLHEAYAVIEEERDELWDEVKRRKDSRDFARVYIETVQIAAMCMRLVHDLVPIEAQEQYHAAHEPGTAGLDLDYHTRERDRVVALRNAAAALGAIVRSDEYAVDALPTPVQDSIGALLREVAAFDEAWPVAGQSGFIHLPGPPPDVMA